MKYGTTNTFKGRMNKKNGHTVSPARTRYFEEKRWIDNKLRNIAKAGRKK